MKLSIVTLALNEEKNLPRCLGAVRRLDPKGWEIEHIVCDGGSKDRTVQLAEELGAKVVHAEPGIPRQRNVGARAATGEVIAQIDADVEVFQGYMDAVYRHFGEGKDLVLGGNKRLPPDASWVAKAYALSWVGAATVLGEGPGTADASSISCMCMTTTRRVYDLVGWFREDLLVEEDTAFVYGAEQAGVPVIVDPTVDYIHHGEPKSFKDFVRKTAWNADYTFWFKRLRSGDKTAWRSWMYWWGLMFTGALLPGPLPAAGLVLTRAAVTATKNRTPEWFPQLVAMYAGYGAGLTAAVMGYSRNKHKRWR